MQRLYRNDYFSLLSEQDKVYIEVAAAGFILKDFDQVLQHVPRVVLSQFFSLKKALETVTGEAIEIGMLKPRVAISLSGDLLVAKLRLNVTEIGA